jgi:energy-coupling factor transport system ATP-binding protein
MEPIIKLEDVRLKYPGGKKLFDDLTLSIPKGDKVLILGPSGSGKSTLIQALSGLIPKVVEVPMLAKETRTPQSWGYVFQDPDAQFCMPYVDEELAFVLENLAVPREEMDKRITELLEMVGLSLPETHMKIQHLSGGMKQRLAIASVLAMEPEVLFLDEPTAMLDPEGTKEVWQTIKQVGKEKTVIIVEHKIEHLTDFVDRIVVLDENGAIVEDGPEDKVFSESVSLLNKYGIWHPASWEEYLTTRYQAKYINTDVPRKVILKLQNFSGYRGKQKKIHIEEALIEEGEWITIVGENGAGKSTLLESVMKLLKTEGLYELEGRPFKRIPSDLVTFVFQNPEFQFVTSSVEDEVAYTLRLKKVEEQEISRRVEELLDRFRLLHVRRHHPYQLSTGQKRRLSVAAAVIHQPKILLLDEPTFGQDSRNTFAMLEWLEEWKMAGVAIVMITHDLHIVREFSDRVWKVEDGRLISQKNNEIGQMRRINNAIGAL